MIAVAEDLRTNLKKVERLWTVKPGGSDEKGDPQH
jgi:hypothetical protein